MTDKAPEPEKAKWAIKNRRVCYQCGYPINDASTQQCPECKSQDIDERRARPRRTEPRLIGELPFPWNRLKMREGGTVILSGNAGSGKTSCCMKLSPTLFISTEQEIQEVAHAWFRIMGDDAEPLKITNCYDWDQLNEDLMSLGRGDRVIVDSVSQFSSGPEASRIVKEIIERIRRAGAMAWFVAQFTKQGDMLGPNMLNHMVDVVCTIPDDPLGMRQLSAKKNRFGSLFSQYFTFGEGGVLVEQDFEYAYTVEGSAGKYRLHLYPMGGSKLGGIFDILADMGVDLEGYASAAVKSKGYKTGFAEPADAKWRRVFAEQHNLKWLSPEDAQQLLLNHEGDQ